MAEFSTWHVLPMGEMPTVRQVLECGGGTWMRLDGGPAPLKVRIHDGRVQWLCGFLWWKTPVEHAQFAVINPKPIEAPMPTPSEVGDESRWRVLCAHKPEGDACTMRTVDGQIEAMFDGDDQWVPLASQWGAGMVAVKESSCTSE